MYDRDRLFAKYRDAIPNTVALRRQDVQRQRGEYIVPGPNYIWSIDGYDKLAPYGIEIYAGIDAYSRYMIWIYIGISNRTAVSVLRQYLLVIESMQQQPHFVRSDRGSETVLLASAHHQLLQAYEADIPFDQTYFYGTSTSNQRIESWWGQLTKGLLFRWRVCIVRDTIYKNIYITNN